jgi:hypothetical protein
MRQIKIHGKKSHIQIYIPLIFMIQIQLLLVWYPKRNLNRILSHSPTLSDDDIVKYNKWWE